MKQNEPSIKRYDMEIDEYVASPESVVTRMGCFPVESTYGNWVKWEDVEELLDKLRSWEIHNDSFHNDLASLTTSYYNSSPK